jgi:GrpB-like predicted nucleotidyltransferase (UPF0157 family)
MTRTIEVVAHDPVWPGRFQEAADELATLFGDEIVAIYHIGSTAVPGLAAKPIVDLCVEVRDLARVDAFDAEMVRRGYLVRGEAGIAGRRFFVKGTEEARSHHVHTYQVGHAEVERHLAFRDYLIAHPAEAAHYGRVKEEAARRYPHNIEGYMEAKRDLIVDLIQKAEAWRGRQGKRMALDTAENGIACP